MTAWLRITEIAKRTNLSRRYWQRCFARGDVPGARQVQLGRRRLFLADRSQFEAWWAQRMLVIPSMDILSAIERPAAIRALGQESPWRQWWPLGQAPSKGRHVVRYGAVGHHCHAHPNSNAIRASTRLPSTNAGQISSLARTAQERTHDRSPRRSR